MGERIARIKQQREKGYLYYVKSDEDGWLCVHKAIMKRGGKKKDKKIDEENKNAV